MIYYTQNYQEVNRQHCNLQFAYITGIDHGAVGIVKNQTDIVQFQAVKEFKGVVDIGNHGRNKLFTSGKLKFIIGLTNKKYLL